MEIALGSMVRDKHSGFAGKVVSRTDFLYGCRRYGVQAEGLHEGKPIETQYFDEPQLETNIEVMPEKTSSTGGPRDMSGIRRPDPR